ncbi:hypothetical protein [Nocardia testacea]|uniref:hypothetical protein n=1 Tax=Nocardia testacea TaxID=248551 RepID=UPI003A88634A
MRLSARKSFTAYVFPRNIQDSASTAFVEAFFAHEIFQGGSMKTMKKTNVVRGAVAVAAFAGAHLLTTVVATAEPVTLTPADDSVVSQPVDESIDDAGWGSSSTGSSFGGSSFATPSGSSEDADEDSTGSGTGSASMTLGDLAGRILFGAITGS